MLSSKKSRKKKVKSNLTGLDINQALDYSYVMMVAYATMLESCEAYKDESVNKAYEKACKAMFDVYQSIGALAVNSDADHGV